jgi:hypothetical protein
LGAPAAMREPLPAAGIKAKVDTGKVDAEFVEIQDDIIT